MYNGCIRTGGWLTIDAGRLNTGLYATDFILSLFPVILLLFNEIKENFLFPTYFLWFVFFPYFFYRQRFKSQIQSDWGEVRVVTATFSLYFAFCTLLNTFSPLHRSSAHEFRTHSLDQKLIWRTCRQTGDKKNCGNESNVKSVSSDAVIGLTLGKLRILPFLWMSQLNRQIG